MSTDTSLINTFSTGYRMVCIDTLRVTFSLKEVGRGGGWVGLGYWGGGQLITSSLGIIVNLF